VTALGPLVARRRWSAAAKFGYVLLFLLGRFQDLGTRRQHALKAMSCARAYLERAEQTLVDAHHCTGVVEFTTVVRRAEQGDKLTLREKLVSVLNDLMSAANEVHVVLLQEAGYYVWSKCKAYTSVILTPPSDVLIGVGPQEIAEESAVGNLHGSVLIAMYVYAFLRAPVEPANPTYVCWSHYAPNLLH
jgi:hypothetical protein